MINWVAMWWDAGDFKVLSDMRTHDDKKGNKLVNQACKKKQQQQQTGFDLKARSHQH